jgi:hypothetical protein
MAPAKKTSRSEKPAKKASRSEKPAKKASRSEKPAKKASKTPAKKPPAKKPPAKKAPVKKAPIDESSWQFYELPQLEKDKLSISFLKKEYPVISNMISSSIENIKSGIFGQDVIIQVEIAVSFYRRDRIEIYFSVAGFKLFDIKIMLKDYDEPKNARITVEMNDHRYTSHSNRIDPSSLERWYIQSRYAVWRLKDEIEDKMKSVNAAIVAKAAKAATLVSSVHSGSDDDGHDDE